MTQASALRTSTDDLDRASGINPKTLYGAELVVHLMTIIPSGSVEVTLEELESRLQLIEALHEAFEQDSGEAPLASPMLSDLKGWDMLMPVNDAYVASFDVLERAWARMSPQMLARFEYVSDQRARR